MKVISIRKSLAPAVVALTAMAGITNTAAAKVVNVSKDNEIKIENTDAHKQFPLKDFLMYTGIGFAGGIAGAAGLMAIKKRINDNKINYANYYDEQFLKDSEEIDKYMTEVLSEAYGNRPYYVDMEEFVEKTKDFVAKHPSRKSDLYMSVRPLSDLRLSDEQAEILCRHFVLKATCTADEWKNMNIFNFLSDTDDYDKIVNELVLHTEFNSDEQSNNTQAKKEEQVSPKETDDEAPKQVKHTDENKNNIEHKLTFKDVGGQGDVINKLKKGILFPIKYPKAFENNSMGHGFVLYGAPGTGKTLIAEALANEADANFIKLNGNELSSKWVGQSEENWRNVFGYAVANQPCIIFIDEFDGVAGKRGSGDIYGDKVLNQILGLLSGVEKNNDQVYVIATTNRLDKVDEAFLRPGRLGTHLELKPPQNEEEVEQILNIHLSKRSVDENLDKKALVKNLLNMKMTGADIAFIVNEAYECAMERMEIYEKMDKGDFQGFEIDYLDIKEQDFQKAIDEYRKSHSKPVNIGFKK